MKWFSNLKIRVRLLISFFVLIVLSSIVSVIGIISLKSVHGNYSYLLELPQERVKALTDIQGDFLMMRYRSANFAMESSGGNIDIINNTLVPQFNSARDALYAHLSHYESLNNSDTRRDKAILQENASNAQKLRGLIGQFTQYSDTVLEFSRLGDTNEATTTLRNAIPLANEINALLNDMITPATEYKDSVITQAETDANSAELYLIALSLSLAVIALILALYIGNTISKSIRNLGNAAAEIARGNLNLALSSNSRDEIGSLTRDLGVVVNSVNGLITDLHEMSVQHNEKGIVSHFADAGKYSGAYSEVIKSVNGMVKGYIETNNLAVNCLGKMAGGDFDAPMEKLPGEKVFINNAIEEMRRHIKNVGLEINTLTNGALAGNLSVRAKPENFTGGWAQIMDGLNNLLISITEPVLEASAVLQELSRGNLSAKVKGNFKGDLAQLSNALGNTTDAISSYVNEISLVLGRLAVADLDIGVTREYIGDFGSIKESMNTIIEQLNNIIGNISSATEQVSAGARNISESSMTLATGATEQAGAVQELSATIDIINEKTKRNADNAEHANQLSDSSKHNALIGNDEMRKMLDAMDGIKESSNNISKIIKTIEDIASQTNLLALNAAVEAARAGEHGKSFAVVASEVRNLAARSRDAAKETASMIEDSISRVNDGTRIAQATANSLQTIVDDVNKVSTIISEIAASSLEQASAISQVTIGLGQISNVVQSNSATSEETASASQELSSQSETLNTMVAKFKLKRHFK